MRLSPGLFAHVLAFLQFAASKKLNLISSVRTDQAQGQYMALEIQIKVLVFRTHV
jgi:hypothetical protein